MQFSPWREVAGPYHHFLVALHDIAAGPITFNTDLRMSWLGYNIIFNMMESQKMSNRPAFSPAPEIRCSFSCRD